MSEPIATYLHDHLGGAQLAIELLKTMREEHQQERLRRFASSLLPEVEADDATLREISEKVGSGSNLVKGAGGWVMEKLAGIKLGHGGKTDFEIFESLELLAIGIQGKLFLWQALVVASAGDERLRGYDFQQLTSRAGRQHERVEEERLELARRVFGRGRLVGLPED